MKTDSSGITETTLAALTPGVCCLVKRVCQLCPHARELHRLGLVEGEEIRVLSKGSCLILQCGGSRVALDRKLAEKVEVIVLPPLPTAARAA